MDNIFSYQPATIAKAFSEHIRTGKVGLKNTDAEPVLEFLYIAYTDVQGMDPAEIDQGFRSSDNHLSKLCLNENNEVFGIVCGLCNTYEKRAFIDAIQIGVHLILELQDE